MHLLKKDLPTGRLSFSQIDTYLNCPKKYEWRYIIKPDIITSAPLMIAGSSIHDAIAIVLRLMMKKKQVDITNIRNNAQRSLEKELNAMQETVGKELLPDYTKERLLIEHKALFTTWNMEIVPEFRPTAVEEEINTTIGGYPFIMYIDAVHNDELVVDWKFTASPKNKHHIANSLQLTVYSIGTQLDRVAFGSLVRPKAGREKNWKPSVNMIKGTRTNAERSWAERVVKLAGDGIRAGHFPYCTPENFLCNVKYCDMYPLCRGKDEAERVTPKWCEAFI